jgi:hypothetical protein
MSVCEYVCVYKTIKLPANTIRNNQRYSGRLEITDYDLSKQIMPIDSLKWAMNEREEHITSIEKGTQLNSVAQNTHSL